jgi:hypothetical protein
MIGGPETVVGPFVGVASTSNDTSIRVFNNRSRYDEWFFVAGQPRVVGNQPMNPMPAGQGSPGGPTGPAAPGLPPGVQPPPGQMRPPVS